MDLLGYERVILLGYEMVTLSGYELSGYEMVILLSYDMVILSVYPLVSILQHQNSDHYIARKTDYKTVDYIFYNSSSEPLHLCIE